MIRWSKECRIQFHERNAMSYHWKRERQDGKFHGCSDSKAFITSLWNISYAVHTICRASGHIWTIHNLYSHSNSENISPKLNIRTTQSYEDAFRKLSYVTWRTKTKNQKMFLENKNTEHLICLCKIWLW